MERVAKVLRKVKWVTKRRMKQRAWALVGKRNLGNFYNRQEQCRT